MAKLNFSDRFNSDKRFATAVMDLQREAIFILLGVDPETVAAAWDGARLNVKASQLVAAAPHNSGEPSSPPFDTQPVPNPIAAIEGKAATEALVKFADAGDVASLKAVFEQEPRVSVAMAAARALIDLRSKKE